MGESDRNNLAHPHDLLVRNVLADTDIAANLLQTYLPPEWGTTLEWASLKRESGETVAPSLSKLVGDLRYSTRFKKSGESLEVFIFLEHQSRVDPFMSLRILGYVCAAYQQRLPALKKGERFPYPLAVVLYHGKKPWKKIPLMRELIAIPSGVANDLLNLPICLIDLAAMPVEQLRGHPMVCALLDSLQSSSLGILPSRFNKIVARLRGLGGEKRLKSWAEALATYYYTLVQGEVKDVIDELTRAFMGVYGKREAKEMGLTVAEKLHRDGMAKGKAEGKIESVMTFLETRFGKLPVSLQKKLMNLQDDAHIEKVLKLAATCQSLKEFQKAL